jgi:hypothetical protein
MNTRTLANPENSQLSGRIWSRANRQGMNLRPRGLLSQVHQQVPCIMHRQHPSGVIQVTPTSAESWPAWAQGRRSTPILRASVLTSPVTLH